MGAARLAALIFMRDKNFYSSNYPEDMVHYKVMRYETGTVPFGTGEDMH